MASGVKIGEAFIEVKADSTNAFKDTDRHASDAGKRSGGLFTGAFGKGLAGMGTALAGAFAVDKIAGFIGTAVTGASDLNEETSKSQVIFGNASGAVKTWAQGAATSVGLSETAALKATGTFGNMFTQLGFSGDAAAAMSKDVVGLSADLGSFNNLPTADVADMMGAAFRGEYDSIQALLPGINAATVEQQALATTGKTSADALTEQEKAAAVLALAHKGGANAAGDFAKTQGGMAGQSKIAAANFENMSASIGSVLLPIANNLMSFVNTNLIPGLNNIGSFIQTNVIPALTAFGNGFMQTLPTLTAIATVIGVVLLPALIRSGIQMAITAAGHVVGWVTMAAGAVANAATVVGAWVLMGFQSMINAARMAAAWLIAMGPIGLVIAAVVGLVAIIVANWDTIVSVTTAVFSAVGSFLTDTWNNIVSFLGQAWNSIVSFVTNGVNTANSIITSVFGAIRSFVSSVFSSIVNFISSAFNNAVNFVSSGVNNIRNFISNGFNAAVGLVSGAFSNIVNAVSGGINNAVSFVSGLPGRVLGALGNMGSMLFNSGKSLIDGFINGIKAMAGNIAGAVGGVLEAARRLFPFSPAKEGPFSGKGYTTYSGKALASDFAQSITAEQSNVEKAAAGLMGAARGSFGGLTSDISVAGSGISGVSAPASTGSSIVQNIHVTIDAKNVKDFNSVVDIMNNIGQTARTGRGAQNVRVA